MIINEYPGHWWQAINPGEKKDWEISPDSVQPSDVILSKRNELGVLSNFAATPFEFDGKKYQSIEGFWQATKYPEGPQDPRQKWRGWPHTRSEVEKMVAFEAKKAGSVASTLMKKNGWIWVSYGGEKLIYRDPGKGPFYQLIVKVMEAKLKQNPEVLIVLCKTRGLRLLPDHDQGPNPPPAWQYHKIWQDLRKTHCDSVASSL